MKKKKPVILWAIIDATRPTIEIVPECIGYTRQGAWANYHKWWGDDMGKIFKKDFSAIKISVQPL